MTPDERYAEKMRARAEGRTPVIVTPPRLPSGNSPEAVAERFKAKMARHQEAMKASRRIHKPAAKAPEPPAAAKPEADAAKAPEPAAEVKQEADTAKAPEPETNTGDGDKQQHQHQRHHRHDGRRR